MKRPQVESTRTETISPANGSLTSSSTFSLPPSQSAKRARTAPTLANDTAAIPSFRQMVDEDFSILSHSFAKTRRRYTLRLVEALPSLGKSCSVGVMSSLFKTLCHRLEVEEQKDILVCVIEALSRVAMGDSTLESSKSSLIDLLIDKLVHMKMGKRVTKKLISSLLRLGSCLDVSQETIRGILNVSKHHLVESKCPKVRVECIRVLTQLSMKGGESRDPMSSQTDGWPPAATIAPRFFADSDSRVRAAALKGVSNMHENGLSLDLSTMYSAALVALGDDYEAVRMEALRLIWRLCRQHPNGTVGELAIPLSMKDRKEFKEFDGSIRLIDDAFNRICNAVTDISVPVRTLACKLLGDMDGVQTAYLLQTLSKEVLKRADLSKGKVRTSHTSAALPRRRWNPGHDIDVERDDVLLTRAGAAGAFVHGLEDEFHAVRNAAVDSMCALCMGCPRFAQACVDFLVDVFNDEIDAVRINAIESVRKIGERVHMKEEQLQVVLQVLEDNHGGVRAAVHRLLASVKLPNITCLSATVQAMVLNLQRYPQDQTSIFLSLASLGRRHGTFAEYVVEELLQLDPNFAPVEPRMDDPYYTAVMAVAFNASVSNAKVLSLLPGHAQSHFRFLKDKFPRVFPDANAPSEALGDGGAYAPIISSSPALEGARGIGLGASLERVSNTLEMAVRGGDGHNEILNALGVVGQSLCRMASLHPSSKAVVAFHAGYARCLRLLILARNHERSRGRNRMAVALLNGTYRLDTIFHGLNGETRMMVLQLRMYAHVLLLLAVLSPSTSDGLYGTAKRADRAVAEFVERITSVQEAHERAGYALPTCLDDLLALQDYLQDTHVPVTERARPLIKLLDDAPIQMPREFPLDGSESFEMSDATIVEPKEASCDGTLEYDSTLPLSINVVAELRNVSLDTTNLMLQVTMPDGGVRLVNPPPSHFTRTSQTSTKCTYKLETRVELRTQEAEWSGPGRVGMRVVHAVRCIVPGCDASLLNASTNHRNDGDGPNASVEDASKSTQEQSDVPTLVVGLSRIRNMSILPTMTRIGPQVAHKSST